MPYDTLMVALAAQRAQQEHDIAVLAVLTVVAVLVTLWLYRRVARDEQRDDDDARAD